MGLKYKYLLQICFPTLRLLLLLQIHRICLQIGREATVHVWDAIDHRILSLLQGGHTRGVSAVDFSSDGERLASLGLDDYHTLVVWNWRKGYKLANARSDGGLTY